MGFYADDNICNYPEGLRILAIDGNAECLEILSHGLKTCGYQVTTMTGMVEAYETLKNNKDSYDLVLTDVNNNMDSFKFADLATVELDIPLIFMSADDRKETIMNCIKHGAQCYLLKPVDYNELKSIWQHVVRKKYLQLRNLSPKEISTQNSVPLRQMESNNDLEGKKQAKAKNKTLPRKRRFSWNKEVKTMFLYAIELLGIENATPMKIHEIMNDPTITRENVASHLQKYRQNLGKLQKEKTKIMLQEYEQATKRNTLPCSRNQGITDLSYQNRSVQQPYTNSFVTDISQASMPPNTFQFRPPMWANTSNIAASSYQNQHFGTTQEMNGMRFNNVYPRPMKTENNYSGAYSGFPGGYDHSRAQILMPPPINSMLIRQPSSFVPLPAQSTQISQPTDSLPMVPPSSSNGQLHRGDSDFTFNMIEQITNNPNWPQLYPDQTLLNSEGECDFTFNSSENDIDAIFNNSSDPSSCS